MQENGVRGGLLQFLGLSLVARQNERLEVDRALAGADETVEQMLFAPQDAVALRFECRIGNGLHAGEMSGRILADRALEELYEELCRGEG